MHFPNFKIYQQLCSMLKICTRVTCHEDHKSMKQKKYHKIKWIHFHLIPLLSRVLSQIRGIHVLSISLVTHHHRWQTKIQAWKQQFETKSIHTIQIVSVQPLCSDKAKATVQSEGALICNFCFKRNLGRKHEPHVKQFSCLQRSTKCIIVVTAG